MFRTDNCSSSGALRKYPFRGAHQDLRALTVTHDKISFLAADYMKYGDLNWWNAVEFKAGRQ